MRGSAVEPSEPVPAPPSSWTKILAAATLGVVGANVVHADVKGDGQLDEGRSYRLIVQSYEDVDGSGAGRRPLASTQRAVTAAELRAGVRVGLLELDEQADFDEAEGTTPVVLAWVEEGKPDLELDGLRARPHPGSLRGSAPRLGRVCSVNIDMRRSRAA